TLNATTFTTIAGVPSTPARFYTLTGSDLTNDVTVTAPAGFQVSTTAAFTGITTDANTLSITPSSGSISNRTIYVRLTGTTQGAYSGTVANTNGSVSAPVLVSGTVNAVVAATLTVGTLNATTFTTIAGVPSTPARFYTLTGSDLTNDVTVTAPAGFQVSTTAAFTGITTDANTLSITPSSGSISNRTIYVRLTGTTQGAYSGTVANTNGSVSAPVLVSGTVNAVVAATLTVGTLNATTFTTIAGVPSTPARFYTLTGSDLTNDVTVTAPAGFQVSTTAAFTGITTDANSLTITPSSGSVNQTIYVRLSGASAGTANSSGVIILNGATITHTSSPATPKNLTVNGNIVVEPTVSSNIAATTVGFNSATISLSDFVPGTGIYALIVVRAAGTPAVAPTDQTAYTANTVYGNNGAASITGPGNYVVLSDIDVSVTVTGLSASTAYTADVYDYNADTPVDGVTFENYKPTPKSVNFTTTTTPLAYYNFTSGVAAAFTATNVMASSFQRGGGLTVNTAAASAGTFASSGYGTNFTANDYVGFSIEPASTYQLNLTSLTYTDIIGTVNGPSTIEVRASTTSDFSGTVVNLATYTTSTTSTERTISLTGTAFQGLKVPV
ncbi:beta strand repeat-containing protein, partial [Hymenobacter persicinus]|uniref:beta strand repeat-containing protein n=1 Tax=Hymenobacter persicinus TaxID=2025506 RepID=UPI0013EA29B4